MEYRLFQQLLLQLLNKFLSLSNTRMIKAYPDAWTSMVWKTFTKSIFMVTGMEMIVFMDQCVRMGGHAKFHMTFLFNRKRNTSRWS